MAVYSLRMLRTLLTFSFFVVEVLSQHKKIVRQAWVHGVAFGGWKLRASLRSKQDGIQQSFWIGDLGGDWMGPCRPRLILSTFCCF